MFRDRTGLVGGPLCGFLRHFAACYTVIQPVIHPCVGLSLKEWKDAGRERNAKASRGRGFGRGGGRGSRGGGYQSSWQRPYSGGSYRSYGGGYDRSYGGRDNRDSGKGQWSGGEGDGG